MKFLSIATSLVALLLVQSLWAGDEGVQEPVGKDEALVFMSVEIPRFMDLNQGPRDGWIIKTYPYISTPRIMGKDSNLMYMGNLKVGNDYRIFDILDTYQTTDVLHIVHYNQGIQGQDEYTVKVEKPGLLYLGDFKMVNHSLVYLGKTQELAMLEKLSGNLLLKPTWKALVDARIKELKK